MVNSVTGSRTPNLFRKDTSVLSRRILPLTLFAGWLGLAAGWPAAAADPPATKGRTPPAPDASPKDQAAEAKRLAEEAKRLGLKDIPRVHLYRATTSAQQKEYEKAIAQFTKVIEKIGLENSCRA
jgi:hypothetical protein